MAIIIIIRVALVERDISFTPDMSVRQTLLFHRYSDHDDCADDYYVVNDDHNTDTENDNCPVWCGSQALWPAGETQSNDYDNDDDNNFDNYNKANDYDNNQW